MTNLLTVPNKAGRAIVEDGAMLACPLLGTGRFIRSCTHRGLAIDRRRLLRLERLGLFAPVFRVRTPRKETLPFHIPPRKGNNWFTKRWAHDTTAVPQSHYVPSETDRTCEGYYSVFQVDYLHLVLAELSPQFQLDAYLDLKPGESTDWQKTGDRWMQHAETRASSLRHHQHRRAVALLCQQISNRYFPRTQTDMRTVQIRRGYFADAWITVDGRDWDWHREARRWDPKKVQNLYGLTPQKLDHAYKGLAIDQASCDPIEPWYQLIQFISAHERGKLKGDALRAATIREGAQMLRLLYTDLYGKDLPHPNEVSRTIITPLPELAVREDTRRHLEFVANRFGVNPQPRLCLLVEGASEETTVTRLFAEHYGVHPGRCGIEIIPLGGVSVATGNRKDDRFSAIIRLIDYLHHHQTFAFLILDNEGYAKRLEKALRDRRSIHGDRRYVTRREYIRLWRESFEFDNFSCTEIAAALTKLAPGTAAFDVKDVAGARRADHPGSALKALYLRKANADLDKVRLAEILVDIMMSPRSRRKIENRPIVKILDRVELLALRNHLPTTQRARDDNQVSRFLDRRN